MRRPDIAADNARRQPALANARRWQLIAAAIGAIVAVSVVRLVDGRDVPERRATRSGRSALRIDVESHPVAPLVPVILPTPAPIGHETFEFAADLAEISGRIAVLERGRDPHLTFVDATTGNLVGRGLPHVVNGDTVRPMSLAVFGPPGAQRLLVLDTRGRLYGLTPDARRLQPFERIQIDSALGRSANPINLASSRRRIAIGGTFMRGERLFVSENVGDWQVLADTSPVRFGLGPDALARSIASASMVALHPDADSALLVGRFRSFIERVHIGHGTLTETFAADESLPAELARRDSAVVLRWKESASPQAIRVSGSRVGAAVLYCDCAGPADSLRQNRRVVILDWQGVPRRELRSPGRISALTLTDSGTIVAIAEVEQKYRLVRWERVANIADPLAGQRGGPRPASAGLASTTLK